MRKSGRRRRVKSVILLVFVLLLGFLSLWVYLRWPEPPVAELQAANEALMSAKQAEAGKYAPQLFNNTSKLYESAMKSWKTENEKFILNRDFAITRAFAIQATQKGAEAQKTATEKAHKIRKNTGSVLFELDSIKRNFERVYYPLPLSKTVRENFNKAVFLTTEARLARERGDLQLAESKLEKARYLMAGSNKNARNMLEDYFNSLSRWRNEVKRAIDQSASLNAPLIIVNKMEHECLLYLGGVLKKRFEAEFGPNWIGDKMYRGDKATPEGVYRVVQKKDQRRTIYYKSLAINYPNEEDRVRFRENVNSGIFSKRLDIGGSIEIHGSGGRGFDWTRGCVALSNKDMDFIYGIVSENTPVVIVGALDPLDKYIN